MDLEKIVYELEEIEAILDLFGNIECGIKIEHISLISINYQEKVNKLIRQLKEAIHQE